MVFYRCVAEYESNVNKYKMHRVLHDEQVKNFLSIF